MPRLGFLGWLALAIAGILVLAPAAPTWASSVSQQPNTKVELLAESREPAAGRPLKVGIAMTPRPGWHTYWVNPGDSGMETRAEWRLPPGVRASPLSYPVPETYVTSGIMNHVYGAEAVLLGTLELPAGLRGALPLEVQLDWLVCDDEVCVPESATLSLPLRVGDGRPDPEAAARLRRAEAALPARLAEPARWESRNGRVRVHLPVPADPGVRAHLFLLTDGVVDYAAPQRLEERDGRLIVDVAAAPHGGASAGAIEALLRLERPEGPIGLWLTAEPASVPPGRPLAAAAPAGAQATPGVGWTGFALALGLALLGGLLLNLMPCVFPILSLKALSLAKSGASPAAARTEGSFYTLGVVLSTTALGAVAIALAAAGQGAGWAFQLQDPRVIGFLMLLVLGIGLNLAGLFEVSFATGSAGQSLMGRPGAQGAFFTGVLAAFIATPCTGPFMAGALGAALVLPPAAGLAVFAGLGLGLALPFLAVGFVPRLRRLIPRPGPWMLAFRRWMAVPMLLTAVGLAWVLGRQVGADALSLWLLVALVFALFLWWLGLRQGRGRALVPTAAALAALLGAPLALGGVGAEPGPRAELSSPLAGAGRTAFSPEALATAQAQRQPLFLYFTADWCVTCKVNERGAMASAGVDRHFAAQGIRVMVADWTRPDPAIARFLADRGRAGIPLYLYYGADGRVEELPQILTTGRLLALRG